MFAMGYCWPCNEFVDEAMGDLQSSGLGFRASGSRLRSSGPQ